MDAAKKKELSQQFSAFINKYQRNLTKLPVDKDFEFVVLGWQDVVINPESIIELNEITIQFNGTASIRITDSQSGVTTSNIPVVFTATAFLPKDIEGDKVIYQISIDTIKILNK